MIKVILNVNGNLVEAKGFNPKKTAVRAAEAADELIGQIQWLNAKNPPLQPQKNVSQQTQNENIKPVPEEKK